MRVLALDLATETGYATNSAGDIESGVKRFEMKRRGSCPGTRFSDFNTWLEGMLRAHAPGLLVYELAHHRGGAATELCVGFATRVMEAAARHGCEYRGVHSGTLKKWATGDGAADKDAMVRAANARLADERYLRITNDNEADAIHLLTYALAGFPAMARAKAKPRKKKVGL